MGFTIWSFSGSLYWLLADMLEYPEIPEVLPADIKLSGVQHWKGGVMLVAPSVSNLREITGLFKDHDIIAVRKPRSMQIYKDMLHA